MSDAETVSEYSPSETESDEFDFGDVLEAVRPKKPCPHANGGLPNFEQDNWDKEYWDCTVCGINGAWVQLVCKQNGHQWVVPRQRVNKAMRFLKQDSAAAVIRPDAGKSLCSCKRSCTTSQPWSTMDVLTYRNSYFQAANELEATKFLAELVRPFNSGFDNGATKQPPRTKKHNTKAGAARRTLVWKLGGQTVCRTFFAAVFGVSPDKMQRVRRLLMDPGRGVAPPRVEKERPKVKYNQCKAFWSKFFNECCQRPNDRERLFPVDMSYATIYEDVFTPWFNKTLPNCVGNMPCMGWFMTARHDDAFADVKDRAKHYHARCQECSRLQGLRYRAFQSAYASEEFKKEWADHQEEKRGWRAFEEEVVLSGKHNPREEQVFWFDDTEAIGFPRCTNRPPKNLTQSRFKLIPFLIADLGRNKEYYVYTAKGRFKKGANRLCTTLLAAIRAAKRSKHESRFARKLTLIADNFSENKNNTLFAFLSDLVSRGWYDEILLVYGPPGHTHNGGDAQHHIHNVVCGNFASATPVHFVARYPQSWRAEHKRPVPCVLDMQYNWDKYYEAFKAKLSNFSKHETDPAMCRGFRFARGQAGIVNMQWKTKAECGEWRGMDGGGGSEGFTVLKGRPPGLPTLIKPTKYCMDKKYYKQLTESRGMKEYLDSQGATGALEWLKKAAKHGEVPIERRMEEVGVVSPGEMGSQVELRCGEVTASVQAIEAVEWNDEHDFWELPAEIKEDREKERRGRTAASERHQMHPAIGYSKIPVQKRPTYQGSAAQAVAEQKQQEQKEDGDESEWSEGAGSGGDDDDDDDGPLQNPQARKKQSRRRSQKGKTNKRRIQEEEDDEPEEERALTELDVCITFGKGENGEPQVWYAVKTGTRKDGFRVQYLGYGSEGEDDKRLILLDAVGTLKRNQVEHIFKGVQFWATTTYKKTKAGKRSKKGSTVRTVSADECPLDAGTIAGLVKRMMDEAEVRIST
jgi:hypothetical protein